MSMSGIKNHRKQGQGPHRNEAPSRFAASLMFTFLTHAFLPSCQSVFRENAARFVVVNETTARLDSITIEPDGKPGHRSLDPGDSMLYVSEMDNHPLVDGSYRLSYTSGGDRKGLVFGYFSNGMPSERGTRILLRPDTVLIRHVY